ncbi:MAG TPA: hypothetical protein VGE88_14205 [Lysobacter sp.]
MTFSTRFLRWTSTPTGRRVLFAITTVAAIVMACNPDLLLLMPMIDAIGLDLLVVLLGAHLVTAVPWLRHYAVGGASFAGRCLMAVGWCLLGGYGRELVLNLTRFGVRPMTA